MTTEGNILLLTLYDSEYCIKWLSEYTVRPILSNVLPRDPSAFTAFYLSFQLCRNYKEEKVNTAQVIRIFYRLRSSGFE